MTIGPREARRLLAGMGRRTGLDLSGLDLSSVRIDRMSWFDRCSFRGCDLRQATLAASFKMCDFSGTSLVGADLRKASFFGCDFSGADLTSADLRGTQFDRVNTGRPDYGHTDLSRAVVTAAQLRGAVVDPTTTLPG